MAGLNKYRAYPEYKDSGVEWLGEIPVHWNINRLGHFFEERREKVSDKDFPALSVTMQGIVPQLETAAKTDAGDNRKLVLKDDFVINSRSDRKGSAGVSRLNGSVSLISIVMQPKKINVNFAHHLLRSYPFQEEFYRYGKGIVADLWSTNASEMKNILLPEIPGSESENIANFLNYETAKIDILIEKQQQLIELLKEKRQAVISHAVTKGLNPDVPMKDSGVEWLDEIPAHWRICKLKNLAKICNGQDYKLVQAETGYPVIGSGGQFAWANTFLYDKPSVLLGRKGTIDKPLYIDKAFWTVDTMYYTEVFDCIIEKYLYYLALTIQFNRYATNTALPSMTQEHLGNYSFSLSFNLSEQKLIINSIEKSLIKIDALTEKQLKQIELLKERRTALISAAVTGKIDLRNWTAPIAKTEAPTEASA
ncbi:restriction endonuclease subunit S [Escherichia coli]|uniref:restriction endonuclease subunit S n=1 Tax=Escherichia coli TaxID=562 RepID=UPI00066A6D87|nr:restriction endonuclease subunit S [Escherichia coli]KMV55918.1 restriction endonuclease subunit S [Escherichia coli]HAJ6270049.1 restriction endonuclease subunit S [Escherichia coli]